MTDKNNRTLQGDYYGSWARTTWEYHFNKDNSFSFKSNGHFGNTRSIGKYSVTGDTLILNSILSDTTDRKGFYNFKNEKFLIDGDSCIISLSTGYDYCKTHLTESKIENSNDVIWTIEPSRKRIEK